MPVKHRTPSGLEILDDHPLAVGTSATMASEGVSEDRGKVVATVATRMFGAPVRPEDVVTETLARVTPENDEPSAAALAAAIDARVPEGTSFEALRRHPLAAWIETELGLQRQDGKWVRTREPRSLRQAAKLLESLTGQPLAACEGALKAFLLRAHDTRDAHGRSLFAFRLHQFVTGGGDLFGTLEPEGGRYFTLDGQQFQPGTGPRQAVVHLLLLPGVRAGIRAGVGTGGHHWCRAPRSARSRGPRRPTTPTCSTASSRPIPTIATA